METLKIILTMLVLYSSRVSFVLAKNKTTGMTVCPRGYRMEENGTSDMLCDKLRQCCQKGHYADKQRGCLLCIPKTKCKSDEKLLFCAHYNWENLCDACCSIMHGWVKFIIQPFKETFKNRRTRKLQCFIGNLTNSLDDCSCNQDSCFPDFLIQKLEQWFSKATDEEVINLPELMQKFNIKKLATRIKRRIKRIQYTVHQCNK